MRRPHEAPKEGAVPEQPRAVARGGSAVMAAAGDWRRALRRDLAWLLAAKLAALTLLWALFFRR